MTTYEEARAAQRKADGLWAIIQRCPHFWMATGARISAEAVAIASSDPREPPGYGPTEQRYVAIATRECGRCGLKQESRSAVPGVYDWKDVP